MIKSRYLLMIFLLALSPVVMNAQENELRAGLRAGHNVAFGGFSAVSLEGLQHLCEDITVSGGLQYNSIGKKAFEARPRYSWGAVSAEVLVYYSNIASVNSFAAGAGACFSFDRIFAKVGYYYRKYGGRGGWIAEPFNIYYDFRVHFLQNIEEWDLQVVITNNEIFELERHYQPTFIAEGLYNLDSKVGFTFGIGYKPAGMFHLSADYYQTYLKAGVCYRW